MFKAATRTFAVVGKEVLVVLRRPYWLRDLLERGLQDHTNRGFAHDLAGLVGDYAPVGRE